MTNCQRRTNYELMTRDISYRLIHAFTRASRDTYSNQYTPRGIYKSMKRVIHLTHYPSARVTACHHSALINKPRHLPLTLMGRVQRLQVAQEIVVGHHFVVQLLTPYLQGLVLLDVLFRNPFPGYARCNGVYEGLRV